MNTVIINKIDMEKCEDFAERCYTTNLDEYSKRNQNNAGKIKDDIKLGKMGEVATFKYLQDNGYSPLFPDFEIYDKDNKSHGYDIETVSFGVSVKTQNLLSSARYGKSWLFQKDYVDAILDDPDNENHLVALCIADNVTVNILKLMKFNDLVFREPKLDKLKKNKYAIYWNDINKEVL